MSADNLYLIRRSDTRYGVSMESASCIPDPDERNSLASAVAEFYYPTPIDSTAVRWFETRDEALSYAHSEYGVEVYDDEDSASDTLAARTQKLLSAGANAIPQDAFVLENDHENGAAVLHWGPYTVRVEGPSFNDAFALAAWITALHSVYER